MINLFEHFNDNTETLYSSLKLAGHNNLTIVMNDDGFLPNEIVTPYNFFADNKISKEHKPKFFNDINIPRFWEIEGNNDVAWIKDMGTVRGKIIYRNHYRRRIVSEVEWLDKQGRVRYSDHYDKTGHRYAQTVFDLSGKAILKKYMNYDGQEVIYENFVTNDIVLDWQGQSHFFDSKVAFILFFIQKLDVDCSSFIINSLATPFAVLYNMDTRGNDFLFWQEHSGGNIPGNMELMFKSQPYRQFKIIVPEREEYDVITENTNETAHNYIYNGGYLYNYHTTNQFSKNTLTMTNSDQIEHIETIVQSCPNIVFHIAAVTEMSTKLMDLGKYQNVKLFPAIDNDTANDLFDICDVYLDINNGGEILDAVTNAFTHDMLIMGYEDIAHNKVKTAPTLLFTKEQNVNAMIQMLHNIYQDKNEFDKHLSAQKVHANEISIEQFNRCIYE